MCRIACARPPMRCRFFLKHEKTHIYICGLKGMEAGVDEALSDICRGSGMDWAELRSGMRAQGRYHVETY